jgi:hypothetical protein
MNENEKLRCGSSCGLRWDIIPEFVGKNWGKLLNISQDSQHSGWESSPGYPEYEAGILLATQPQISYLNYILHEANIQDNHGPLWSLHKMQDDTAIHFV